MAGLAGKLGAVYKEYTATDKSKLIADFQDDETWTSGAGTQADDGTNFRLGTESVRITENNGTGGLLYSDQNSVSLNLATFASGAASDTSDYIYLIAYISDVTKVTDIQVGFSTEATYDGDPSYAYTISTGLVAGWNYIKILKSAFTDTNMSDWTGIQSMRIGWTSTASATAAYISFQALYLVDDSYEFILANNTAYTMAQTTLVTNWSLDMGSDMADTSSLGNEWKEFCPTLNEFSATVERFWADEENTDNLGTAEAIALYTNTPLAYRYDGLGKMSSVSITDPVADLVTESVEWTGSGAMYYTALVIKDS